MADTDHRNISQCAAGVSFTQAELDQIFELLEEFEEMPILFSDETLAYIRLGISNYINTHSIRMACGCLVNALHFGDEMAQPHSILAAWAGTLQALDPNTFG